MIIADFLPARPDRRWDLARQCGVTHAIVKMHPDCTGEAAGPEDIDTLARVQARFAEAGLRLYGLEGDPFDMERIKQGRPGLEADLERYRRMLHNLGELGIPLLCYNFMAGIGWFRTRHALPERGGALVSGFDLEDLSDSDPHPAAPITAADLWANYRRFLAEVLPTAERCGVRMGLHPDDPPVTPLRGIARIFTNPEAVAEALALSDSPSHGLSFCQGSFGAMGADLPACLHRFAARIVFAHFRDVTGRPTCFRETFHDNGPTDMPALLRRYRACGIDVPIRVDHVPTLAGEDNSEPGYAALGRLYAIGYLRGILDSIADPAPATVTTVTNDTTVTKDTKDTNEENAA